MPASHHSGFTGRMPFLPPNQQRQLKQEIKQNMNLSVDATSSTRSVLMTLTTANYK